MDIFVGTVLCPPCELLTSILEKQNSEMRKLSRRRKEYGLSPALFTYIRVLSPSGHMVIPYFQAPWKTVIPYDLL